MSFDALLKLPCYIVAVILGRPTALAVAYVDHIPVELAGPLAAAVMYGYARFLMARGSNLLERAATSRWKWMRELPRLAENADRLPTWSQGVLVAGFAVAPTIGLWLAVGFAVACGAERLQRNACLIAGVSAFSLVAAQLAMGHYGPPLGGAQPALEVASYVLVGAAALFQVYRHREDLRHPHLLRLSVPRLRRTVTPVPAPVPQVLA